MRVSAAVVMQMHRDGYSDQQIADQTGAALADVTAILDTHKTLAARAHIPPREEPPAVPNAVELLAWGTRHEAAAVRRHAERALDALESLHARHKDETELLRISGEVDALEQRMTRLRSRQAELKGSKGTRRSPTRDYVPAEVRAWARQAGVGCPPNGTVPKPVLAQWRAATGRAQP
ncbi:hypothetical protein ACGFZK_32580 [Streptomyces sp. NPDC048257]|uniref:hypothetical protein n=1 Tax=Streptomyces sp. NPDC048257 TaxID=3365526 RepID=UPI0037203290